MSSVNPYESSLQQTNSALEAPKLVGPPIPFRGTLEPGQSAKLRQSGLPLGTWQSKTGCLWIGVVLFVSVFVIALLPNSQFNRPPIPVSTLQTSWLLWFVIGQLAAVVSLLFAFVLTMFSIWLRNPPGDVDGDMEGEFSEDGFWIYRSSQKPVPAVQVNRWRDCKITKTNEAWVLSSLILPYTVIPKSWIESELDRELLESHWDELTAWQAIPSKQMVFVNDFDTGVPRIEKNAMRISTNLDDEVKLLNEIKPLCPQAFANLPKVGPKYRHEIIFIQAAITFDCILLVFPALANPAYIPGRNPWMIFFPLVCVPLYGGILIGIFHWRLNRSVNAQRSHWIGQRFWQIASAGSYSINYSDLQHLLIDTEFFLAYNVNGIHIAMRKGWFERESDWDKTIALLRNIPNIQIQEESKLANRT
jgi:hypothetical protein